MLSQAQARVTVIDQWIRGLANWCVALIIMSICANKFMLVNKNSQPNVYCALANIDQALNQY